MKAQLQHYNQLQDIIGILGPFFVAELFTNCPGQYVKLQATISGLTGLVDGEYDQWVLGRGARWRMKPAILFGVDSLSLKTEVTR